MDLRGSSDVEIDREYLQQSVQDFIALCLLYREQIAADAPDLPRRDPTSAPSKRKQRIHQRRTTTLFRVVSLESPADNFGRPVESLGGGGWQLAYRVTVRGHFRHQPHGPERSLRKLIWIDEHHRGPNRDAPVLNPLRKPHHAV